MHTYLENLNDAQRRAVTHSGKPLLVVAGPGSGKTRVVIGRISFLVLSSGIKSDRILAITFAQRAAQELRERLYRITGVDSAAHIGTFHWLCHGLLRRHIHILGYRRDFRLLDPRESRAVVRSIMRGMDGGAEVPVSRVTRALSSFKNGTSLPEASARAAIDSAFLDRVHTVYQSRVVRRGILDLDDLLVLARRLLAEHDNVRTRYRNQYAHLLVDEYQDVNPVQRDIVRMLLPTTGNLIAVGDDDQAIYGWRQASAGTMLCFSEDFPGAEVLALQTTYRSTKSILRAARSLAGHNATAIPKQLQTVKSAGKRPTCFVADDEVEEAEWIAGAIRDLVNKGRRDWCDVAVLYRVHAQSRVLEDTFLKQGIPYVVKSGTRFYDRPEIRCALSLLCLALDPLDGKAAAALLTLLPGMGPRRIQIVREHAEPANRNCLDLACEMAGDGRIPGRLGPTLEAARQQAASIFAARSRSLKQVVETAVAGTLVLVRSMPTTDYDLAVETLGELVTIANDLQRTRTTLRELVGRLTLNYDAVDGQGGVNCMSLHASKGLEFAVVFMPGMEEGVLPHRKSMTRSGDLEEERRLCYVGMTRALDEIHFSYAHTRELAGASTIAVPSRFISEMGGSHFDFLTSTRAQQRPRLARVAQGDRVRHSRWGEGTITQIEGTGRDTIVTIGFANTGVKRLQLCYAPLSQVSEDDNNALAG